jgi:hypothetical protein
MGTEGVRPYPEKRLQLSFSEDSFSSKASTALSMTIPNFDLREPLGFHYGTAATSAWAYKSSICFL